MNVKNFIFSEKKSDHITRHLLFCFCYWSYFTFFHLVNAGSPKVGGFRNIPYTVVEAFNWFLPQIFFTYALISFVLPRYLLKSKYLLSLMWIIFLLTITFAFAYSMVTYFNEPITKTFLPEKYMVYDPRPASANFFIALNLMGKGALTVAAGACSIKLVKYWHLKEKRNLELLKEKTEAQLQLLTAQVHPHFLFNTLNNIYSKAQNESPGSARMIMELSHILRYVLDEGKRDVVPLEKELQMLMDYINLEKMRYDNKLDLHVSLPPKTEGVYIVPLLLLPFVENCFKHGASKMLNNPWVNLKIELQGMSLVMKLMNGKSPLQIVNGSRKGTGIDNVKKRLELLYKDNYQLQINEEEEVFVVNLKLQLSKIIQTDIIFQPLNLIKEYA